MTSDAKAGLVFLVLFAVLVVAAVRVDMTDAKNRKFEQNCLAAGAKAFARPTGLVCLAPPYNVVVVD